jgi:hypothetical protein
VVSNSDFQLLCGRIIDFSTEISNSPHTPLRSAVASVALDELVRGSMLGGRLEELRRRSVLIRFDSFFYTFYSRTLRAWGNFTTLFILYLFFFT